MVTKNGAEGGEEEIEVRRSKRKTHSLSLSQDRCDTRTVSCQQIEKGEG